MWFPPAGEGEEETRRGRLVAEFQTLGWQA